MYRTDRCFSSLFCVGCFGAAAGLCVCAVCGNCFAADTIETWEPGFSDFEIYAGYDGIGRPQAERSMAALSVIGVGIVPRFSGYVSVAAGAGEDLSNAEAALSIGVFGTPVDTRYFDLDLLLDVAVHGPGLSSIHILPMAEMNLDLRNFGFYFRTGGNLEGTTAPDGAVTRSLSVLLNPGAYVILAERHQLLIEYDGAVLLNGDGGYEQGGVAFGYNVTLSDRVELINQLYLGIPTDGTDVFGAAAMGIIVSL